MQKLLHLSCELHSLSHLGDLIRFMFFFYSTTALSAHVNGGFIVAHNFTGFHIKRKQLSGSSNHEVEGLSQCTIKVTVSLSQRTIYCKLV